MLTAQQKHSLYESKGASFEICEKCGCMELVQCVPTGSIARLTLICQPCLDQLARATKELHARYDGSIFTVFSIPKAKSWT